MTNSRFLAPALTALVLATDPTAAHAAEDGWSWAVAPYLWMPSIKADLREDLPPAENQRDYVDWIDKLDFAFLGHVEGQGDRFGMFGDLVYLSLGDSHSYPRVRTEGNLDASIVELAAVLPMGEERFEGFDLFGGVRYFDLSVESKFDPVNELLPTVSRKRDEGFTDFMFGARYTAKLSDRWGITVRGDGSTGDTDGSWSVGGNVQYHMRNGFWVFGYRYMEVDLPMRDSSLDLKLYGPLVGYAFTF